MNFLEDSSVDEPLQSLAYIFNLPADSFFAQTPTGQTFQTVNALGISQKVSHDLVHQYRLYFWVCRHFQRHPRWYLMQLHGHVGRICIVKKTKLLGRKPADKPGMSCHGTNWSPDTIC